MVTKRSRNLPLLIRSEASLARRLETDQKSEDAESDRRAESQYQEGQALTENSALEACISMRVLEQPVREAGSEIVCKSMTETGLQRLMLTAEDGTTSTAMLSVNRHAASDLW